MPLDHTPHHPGRVFDRAALAELKTRAMGGQLTDADLAVYDMTDVHGVVYVFLNDLVAMQQRVTALEQLATTVQEDYAALVALYR